MYVRSIIPRFRSTQNQGVPNSDALSQSLSSLACGSPCGMWGSSKVRLKNLLWGEGLFQKLPSTDFVLLGLLVECALKTSKAESRH